MTYAQRAYKKFLTSDRYDHNEQHPLYSDFDFHCIAHGEDYSPKYMKGEICHNGMSEGFCLDGCNLCPSPCPVVGCNKEEYYD